LGSAPSVNCDIVWSRDAAYFGAGRATRATWGGGVLLSVAIHAIDAICFALGRPLALAKGVVAIRPAMDVETSAATIMRFEGGAIATLRATFDGASNSTRLSFAGAGLTGIIDGPDADPTAGAVRWLIDDADRMRTVRRLDEQCRGSRHGPLLVPFLHDGIRSVKEGRAPGDCDSLPSVESTRDAHRAVFDVYAAPADTFEGAIARAGSRGRTNC
jgi:predicted dehydrogenase